MNINRVKHILLDLVSFDSPQAIVFNLSAIILTLALLPPQFLGGLPTTCIFRTIIFPILFKGNCPTSGFFADCECPACGMTRAMSNLLHGNIEDAYGFNKGALILLPTMLVIIVLNIRKSIKIYKKTSKILPY